MPVSNMYTGESANISLLLDGLLHGYDKRLRPNYKGNETLLFFFQVLLNKMDLKITTQVTYNKHCYIILSSLLIATNLVKLCYWAYMCVIVSFMAFSKQVRVVACVVCIRWERYQNGVLFYWCRWLTAHI